MPEDLISTGFTAASTADDVLDGVDLADVRAIVTGGSSGLGIETARALAAAGATVTLAVRNLAAGRHVAAQIETSTALRPQVMLLDLADQDTVAGFIHAWDGPLHLLINNAGLVTAGLERTREGWERQFAINHLGHFALAAGLHPYLAQGAADRDGARIVALSSTAHMRSGVDFDDLHFERRGYDPQIAYAQSKTANSLFAVEASRRWAADGIVVNAVNPGGVATGLQRNFSARQKESLDAAEAAGVFAYKTVEQGAATTLVAAVAPEFAHTGGHYLDDGQEAYSVPDDATLAEHPHGVKRWALDPVAAERLLVDLRRPAALVTRRSRTASSLRPALSSALSTRRDTSIGMRPAQGRSHAVQRRKACLSATGPTRRRPWSRGPTAGRASFYRFSAYGARRPDRRREVARCR